MREKRPKSEGARSDRTSTSGPGRRKFIKDSLGAAPVVLTIGNRSGWGGGSMHGTLWSSGGTNWRHKGGRWWRKGDWKDWEERKPPRWSDHDDYRSYEPRGHERKDQAKNARQRDWEWDDDIGSRDHGSSSFSEAERDWKRYREKERRREEIGSAEEERIDPSEPSNRFER